jgi:hypothetical protein
VNENSRCLTASDVAATATTEPGPAAAPTDLHRSPPITLRAIRQRLPWLLPVTVSVVVVLGVLAAIDDGRWLVWDPPITRLSIEWRTAGVNRVALWVSRLGSTPVVIVAGLAGVVVAARRCRAVAVVMLVTVAARPPFEWLVKEVLGRPRPSGARLVPGTGFSYPSGHVLAAAATWGSHPGDRRAVHQATIDLVDTDNTGMCGDRARRLVPSVARRALDVRRRRRRGNRLRRPVGRRSRHRPLAPATNTPRSTDAPDATA